MDPRAGLKETTSTLDELLIHNQSPMPMVGSVKKRIGMSPGNAREPNPSMYRTSNTFARHTPRASPSVFQHPAPVHRSTHYAQRTHSISPGPPTHIQTHNHADGQRHTGVPAVGRGQGIGGVGGHNGGSHYSNGGSPLPHMGGYSPGLYAEGHRDRVDPDSQSGAENSRKAVKLTPRGTNVYVMHSTANSSSNTPVERSGGYTQTPTSAHAYAGTTTYRHPTSHTQAHRRSVGEGSDYGSVGRASGGNHGNQHGANGGGSHAHRSTDDTEHDPEHEREGGRDSEHEADVLYTLGAMEENTNVLGARPVLDTEREVDITFLGASSSVGVSASMHIERVAVPVWGGVGVDSVESVTAAVAESTMEAVVRDSTVEIGYASTSPVMESSRHLEETEASAGQSSSMPDISRDGGSHTHVVHTSHSETMVVEESSDGEGSVSMYDGVPMAPASPPSGKRLSVTESGAGEPEGPSTGGTDGSSKTSERGEGEGVGTCTGDVSDDTRLGGMATRQGDVSDGGAQQTRNGGQPSTLEHKNYLNAQGVHDGTRHSPRLLRGPREGQARGAKDTHTSPLLGAKSTPESPRLTAKNAPKSPRLIAKNTPKNPRLIAKNTPKSPRVAAKNTPKSPRLIAKNTPISPRLIAKNTPKSPRLAAKNTPKSPRLTTKTTPKDPRLTAKNTPKGPTVPAKNTQSISLAVTRNTPKPSALQRKSPRKTPRSLHDSFAVADTSVGVQGATNLKGYPKTESAANSSRKLTDWIIKPYDDVYEDGFCVEGTTVPGNVYWHSTRICTRLSATLLQTRTGSLYELLGGLNLEKMQQIDIPEAITAQFLTGFPENWMVLAEEYFDTLKASAQQYASDSEDERHARDIESFAPNTKPEEKESHATAAGERVPAGEVHEREKDIDAVPSSGDEETSVATEKSTSVKKKPQSPAKNALKPPTTARKTPTKVGKTHTTRATRSHPEVIVPAATEPTQTSTTKKSTTIRKAGRARAGSDGGSDHEDRRDTKRTRTSTQLPQENRVIAREATNTAQITDPEAEIPSITKQNSSHIQMTIDSGTSEDEMPPSNKKSTKTPKKKPSATKQKKHNQSSASKSPANTTNTSLHTPTIVVDSRTEPLVERRSSRSRAPPCNYWSGEHRRVMVDEEDNLKAITFERYGNGTDLMLTTSFTTGHVQSPRSKAKRHKKTSSKVKAQVAQLTHYADYKSPKKNSTKRKLSKKKTTATSNKAGTSKRSSKSRPVLSASESEYSDHQNDHEDSYDDGSDWDESEVNALHDAVASVSPNSDFFWADVAQFMDNRRTDDECKEKYNSLIGPS